MHIKIVTLITLALHTFPLMSSCCRSKKTAYELIATTDSPTHIKNYSDNGIIDQTSALPRYYLQKPPATQMQKLLNIGKYGAYGAGLFCAAGIVVTVGMAIPYLPLLVNLPSIAENLDYLKNVSETLLACPAAQECLIKAAAHCG